LRKTQLKKEAIEGLSIAEMAKNAYNEGVISVAEQNQLIALDELLRDAVAVDEFKK
jgi:predicted restriction endonuclease